MRIVIANLSSALTSLLSSSWVYKPQEWIFSGVLELIFELMHVKMIIIAGLSCISSFASRSWSKEKNGADATSEHDLLRKGKTLQ